MYIALQALICMETGFIPPNLNYNKPREGMNGLLEGRMKVVTEKMPLPDDRGWFGNYIVIFPLTSLTISLRSLQRFWFWWRQRPRFITLEFQS